MLVNLPKQCMRFLLCTLLFSLLIACTSEVRYRGVPRESWNQLNSEQKQLIVDKSFVKEFQRSQT